MAATERTGHPLLTPANLLTFSRLVFLPVIIYGVVSDRHWVAVGAMAAAWLTDLLDGRVARMMREQSDFGQSLDSTVDFILIYGLFIAFYAAGSLTTWQFAFLYLAMAMILALQFSLSGSGRPEEVASTRLGKPTGALQYAYLIFLVVREVPAVREIPSIETAHTVYFAILASAIVVNAVECGMAVQRLRPDTPPQ